MGKPQMQRSEQVEEVFKALSQLPDADASLGGCCCLESLLHGFQGWIVHAMCCTLVAIGEHMLSRCSIPLQIRCLQLQQPPKVVPQDSFWGCAAEYSQP